MHPSPSIKSIDYMLAILSMDIVAVGRDLLKVFDGLFSERAVPRAAGRIVYAQPVRPRAHIALRQGGGTG
jgi:hypothetical protein